MLNRYGLCSFLPVLFPVSLSRHPPENLLRLVDTGSICSRTRGPFGPVPFPTPHHWKTSYRRDGFGVIHQNYLLRSNCVCASTVVGSGVIAGNQKIKHCVLLEPTVSWGGRPETRRARKICDMVDETYHGKKLTWLRGKRGC